MTTAIILFALGWLAWYAWGRLLEWLHDNLTAR